VRKIVALGVLHHGTLPEHYLRLYNEFLELTSLGRADDERVQELFEVFKGAFIRGSPIETPFGKIPFHLVQGIPSAVVREDEELLAGEFSLDAFLALLALYAHERGIDPLPVLPLFVGLTRGPGGGFVIAAQLAGWLKEIVDRETALVATGDLVHYGTAYSSPAELIGKPVGLAELRKFFLERVRDALKQACRGNYEAFYQISTEELKSDQRQIVPIICEYLGKGAGYEILQFELSDYSRILGAEPPCVVASALVGFTGGR